MEKYPWARINQKTKNMKMESLGLRHCFPQSHHRISISLSLSWAGFEVIVIRMALCTVTHLSEEVTKLFGMKSKTKLRSYYKSSVTAADDLCRLSPRASTMQTGHIQYPITSPRSPMRPETLGGEEICPA